MLSIRTDTKHDKGREQAKISRHIMPKFDLLEDRLITFFYKHSVFQSEARICLSFSQSQPQMMLEISLSKNIDKRKFHNLTHEVIKMKKILIFVPSRLLIPLTKDKH